MDQVQKTLEQNIDFKQMYSKYKKFLKGAKEGEVVTRFPPEPSGYLHVGHIKAALLNFHYAKMFKGKMILRFDDTNPAKENSGFQKAIQEDLHNMGIIPDTISSSSDYFEMILEKAEWFIQQGLAFCDDTDGETMKSERMQKIESKHRNQTPEEALKIFKLMKEGDEKVKDFCLRAKINMASDNGCLRDPVIFRKCLVPHHATGTKYKIYPTYDFACPIIDSHEGVTHALRSNEYADRNALYNYMLKKLELRKVTIQDFSRLNFVKTTLSKRKLNWFIDEGIISDWNDPRFPTFRGIYRRGMTIPALVEFMLEQGPSKNANLMEWDKIWALNRKLLDKDCYRYTAINKDSKFELEVIDTADEHFESQESQLHPKRAEEGMKLVLRGKKLIVDKADMESLEVGSKLVLLKWGVFEIIEKSENKATVKFLPEDKDFKNPPKLTWLLNDDQYLIRCVVEEYDQLLTKDKPDPNEEFKDIINFDSFRSYELLGEGALKNLQVDDRIQFERIGFFRLDQKVIENGDSMKMTFINIPEGKQKTMGGKAVKN